jgi:hypothetical protein
LISINSPFFAICMIAEEEYSLTHAEHAMSDTNAKKLISRAALEALVLKESAGEWGCEDITGVTIEKCDPRLFGRNWTVVKIQNQDLPAGTHTVQKIAEALGRQYELQPD